MDSESTPSESTPRENGEAKTWHLSGSQLNDLQAWMRAHYPDLDMILATSPAPLFSVVTFDADENRTQIDPFPTNEGWARAVYVLITRKDGTMSYSGQLSLAPEGIASLRYMLADKS